MGSHSVKPAASGNGNTRDTSSGSKHAATGQTGRDAGQLATGYAAGKGSGSSGKSHRSGKPSTTRSTVGGAAAGTATGAAIGSVVPGIGTAVGAGAGAVIGGAGGALKGRSAKKDWKAAGRGDGGGSRRALLAEFTVCILILALSPLARGEGETKPKDWMKRGSAMCGVFILLGMVSGIGPRAARVSVAIGGLITLALLVDQREVFGVLTTKLKSTGSDDQAEGVGPGTSGGTSSGSSGGDGSAGGTLGGALGDFVQRNPGLAGGGRRAIPPATATIPRGGVVSI